MPSRIVIALALTAVLAPAAPAAAEPRLGLRTVDRGDRGPDVRELQRTLGRLKLRVGVDGVFGRRTHRAVRRYERRVRIAVDGAVSPGQARGMRRRAGTLPRSRASAPPPAPPAAPGAFPIAGAWEAGGPGAGFGERGGAHEGVDLFASCGTPLVSPHAGEVSRVSTHSRAGHYVVVRSAATGEEHVFMHLREPTPLSRGDAVAEGQAVGAVGQTGNARGCHLHFEIWTAPGWYRGGKPRDPAPDLRTWSG